MEELVSVVLTCYYEGRLLERTMPVLVEELDRLQVNAELLVVVDGTDDETDVALDNLCSRFRGLRIIRNSRNIGRGGSVARGVREAQGNVAGFLDPDLEIPAQVIRPMLEALATGADLALAHRQVPIGSKNFLRWVLSRGYKSIANRLLALPDFDTEAGCKFFRVGPILPVLDMVQNERWFWDTELVALAHRRGLRIAEVPAPYVRNPEHLTTVRLRRDIPEYWCELLRLRRQLARCESAAYKARRPA